MRNSTVKGFTLIELIVVIAIIGVLAAILVPSMIGYLADSKLATANSNAKLAFENIATLCTKLETAGYPAGSDTSSHTVSLENGAPDTITPPTAHTDGGVGYIASELPKLMQKGGVEYTLTSAGFPDNTKYAKTTADLYVGAYPTAATAKSSSALSY
ncbi:MAG: type II secretion system protein [Ruminococcus sp.]|nr:type II secretion system protein [Ruminococcus sp.]